MLSGEGSDEAWGGYLYFWQAPSPEAMAEECARKISRLHAFDCLRANKALAAHGVECRVPFLDQEVLRYTMEVVHPEHKMSKTHPDGPRIEKFELRKMFQFDLPEEIIVRTKAQFSDAVGSQWIESLKNLAKIRVSDELMAKAPPHIKTKEAYLYWSIFKECFYHLNTPEDAVIVEDNTIACSTAEAVKWNPKFSQYADPSGDSVILAMGIE